MSSTHEVLLALFEQLPSIKPNTVVGLVAFGGGFTFGGTLLRKP
jgi:3-oxoacyl-[acyl-carrier-protein] synthase III